MGSQHNLEGRIESPRRDFLKILGAGILVATLISTSEREENSYLNKRRIEEGLFNSTTELLVEGRRVDYMDGMITTTYEGKFENGSWLIEGRKIDYRDGRITSTYEGKFDKSGFLVEGKHISYLNGRLHVEIEGVIDGVNIKGKRIWYDENEIIQKKEEGIIRDNILREGELTIYKDGNVQEIKTIKNWEEIKNEIPQ